MYEDLITKIELVGDVEPVSKSNLDELKSTNSDLPTEYYAFLEEVGFGDVVEDILNVYNGIVEPSDIYDSETIKKLKNFHIFGDDYSGRCYGFLDGEVAIYSFTTDLEKPEKINSSFLNFINEVLKDNTECR